MLFVIQTIRGEACLQAGQGIEQVNWTISDAFESLRQSSARLRREMNEPLAPRSESGQLAGHCGSLGQSKSLVNGMRPSINNEYAVELLTSTSLREPFGGVLRSLASYVFHSEGSRVPIKISEILIEKLSWRAVNANAKHREK